MLRVQARERVLSQFLSRISLLELTFFSCCTEKESVEVCRVHFVNVDRLAVFIFFLWVYMQPSWQTKWVWERLFRWGIFFFIIII